MHVHFKLGLDDNSKILDRHLFDEDMMPILKTLQKGDVIDSDVILERTQVGIVWNPEPIENYAVNFTEHYKFEYVYSWFVHAVFNDEKILIRVMEFKEV